MIVTLSSLVPRALSFALLAAAGATPIQDDSLVSTCHSSIEDSVLLGLDNDVVLKDTLLLQVTQELQLQHNTSEHAVALQQLPSRSFTRRLDQLVNGARQPIVIEEPEDEAARSMGLLFEISLCFLWLCMVASAPLWIALLEGHFLKVHFIQAFSLFAIIGFGTILFSHVIHFNSYHWEGSRTLTMVETVYFTSQILVTVGYGDITPAFCGGRFLVGLYTLFAVIYFANIVAHVQTAVSQRLEEASTISIKQQNEVRARRDSVMSFTGSLGQSPAARTLPTTVKQIMFETVLPGASVWSPWAVSACFFAFVLIGATVMWRLPGEDKTPAQALYMSVITLTATGFGDYVADTNIGKLFCAYWFVFGGMALMQLIICMTEAELFYKKRKAAQEHYINEVRVDSDKYVNKYEFLRYALLKSQIANVHQLENIEKAFSVLANQEDKVHIDLLAQVEGDVDAIP